MTPNLPPKTPQLRTDFGTFLLHFIVGSACITALLTGLRFTADTENAVFAAWLSPILPQGEIWSWHILSGLTLFFAGTAYVIYLSRAGLGGRTSSVRFIPLTMSNVSIKLKLLGANVLLHWVLYGLVSLLTVTGILMYIGFAGIIITLHMSAAYGILAYIFAHLLSHFIYGGWRQWLRVFYPQELRASSLTRSKPLGFGLAIGAVFAGGLYFADSATRQELVVKRVSKAPVLDGVLDDEAWQGIVPAFVRTSQGSNLGETGSRGTSKVWVKAVRHEDHIYFAFKWEDPTRSVKRVPTIKKIDGWHVIGNHKDDANETAHYEDKFGALFTKTDAFANGGTSTFGPNPLGGAPSALNNRGLHYTRDGSMADVWQWKATRGGLLGKMDDMHFGPPKPFTPEQARGQTRYSGGYDNDPGKSFYIYNFIPDPVTKLDGLVKLRRLPLDYAKMREKMGEFKIEPFKNHDAEGAQGWMFENETAPWSQALEDKIPVGAILPSTLIMGDYVGDRADVDAGAKWKDGYWTLETKRKVTTTSVYDLPMDKGFLYLWLAVFDNSQTRHTRHQRPIKLIF
jgi:Ethylbenzene dehydrogenase/Prokaryotic cytochrome b561